MRDIELLTLLLCLEPPWFVTEALPDPARRRVDVRVEWRGAAACPACSRTSPQHDARERSWRDLDLCAYELFIHAAVPSFACPEHGAQPIPVPWARGLSNYTKRF